MKLLIVGLIAVASVTAVAQEIKVEGLPAAKVQIKSSLNLKSASELEKVKQDRKDKQTEALAKLKTFIQTELGKKAVGSGECRQVDVKANYSPDGSREGWVIDECSVSFL